ncbi:MAG: bifunctional oligoribonuclease/PAP phosphatase NrnA [Clostridiales bacterium]|nr:bifunctional oligoribonuclease/PAP phosphatase NrnA [Clostridiales bacterium]MCF8022182.1 bifunctional oligoribonuclease/PAP phosphatase NrnA [Clostridiales bacterium]
MNSLEEIITVINKNNKFVLCGHIMPDGDSLGSVLALGIVLKSLGKQVTMVSKDPVPDNLTFLPGLNELIIGDKEFDEDYYDVGIILDCSVPDRMGDYERILDWNIITINIDHHPDNGISADYNYVDFKAAAAGEILYDMMMQAEMDINIDAAVCLYTAIITDTGSFQYENTTPSTHRRIADLLEKGIQPGIINVLIFDQKPLPSLFLLRNVLQTLKISECGRIAWMSVFKGDLDRVNARDEHTESLINYPRSIKGIEVAILIRELDPGVFKISFRSKGAVNVNNLAGKFDGGGHVKASGCILKGDFRKIENKLVNTALGVLPEKGSEPKWTGF